MSIADVARRWQATGVSVVPIKANGTKQPAVQWAPYQAVAPTLSQIDQWWSNGQQYGLALICGTVSGNLEMLELEGRATGTTSLSIIAETIKGTEVEDTWNLLTGPEGYMEWTPSGGIHLLYRISDHAVPGNTKVARTRDRKVLAETRGEGGYVVVAPTSGLCHPSGESWELLSGDFGSLPVITWDQRTLLHEAIRLCLDEEDDAPQVDPPTLPSSPARLSVGGSSPGDEFEATTDWTEILGPHGWTLHSRRGIERHWTRDGKNPRNGISATTGYKGDRDRLYVFSTSTIFDTEKPYTKFGAYAVLNHGGNFKAAATELARQGFGTRAPQLTELVLAQRDVEEATPEDPRYPANDSGNARYLHDRVKDQYHWVPELKDWLRWDGRVWRLDRQQALSLEFQKLVDEKRQAAVADEDNQTVKRWTKAGDQPRIAAAMRVLQSQPDVTLVAEKLDPNRNMVNVLNGVLDLRSGELHPHDSSYLMTKMMNVSFRPDATCPNFETFMDKVLPDPGMRTYVQRALGYTLLGDADQRAMFLIYGPSGTGKSTLMETMSEVFGEYGTTAPTGTFRARSSEQGPTNDLHALMGRRFVSSSETNEGTLYNEDLLKRLTGRDKVTSRALYQENQEWVPVCTLWLATNHLPRFSTDDDAIWRRLKLVPFTTILVDEPDHEDDYSRMRLVPEKDGILNWLLQGLREFLEFGLGEPPEVKEAAQGQRLQSDPVSQFLEDRLEEGVLIRAEGYQIKLTELYSMYVEWARLVGERAVGSRRFNQRLANGSSGMEMYKVGQQMFWQGLGRAAGTGMLGTMIRSGWGAPDPG